LEERLDLPKEHIVVEGARQNNLKELNLKLPLHELIVVTGVSGSGKSSLAFDTVYAEGQRRYVETFSPYARQFLDRMDKPQADRIDGIPPAIAIDQTNPVRTSRSTVGTMTELNDHLKLLFARCAHLYCRSCGTQVRRDSPDTIFKAVSAPLRGRKKPAAPLGLITFPVRVPENFSEKEIRELLEKQGYTRIHRKRGRVLEVIQDRTGLESSHRARVVESLEAALRHGQGHVTIYELDEKRKAHSPRKFSSTLHCPACDIDYADPIPSHFSFNSPVGACDACRGFGRTMGIDYGLVVPDVTLSLADGAIRPWQTGSYRECNRDLKRHAKMNGVPIDVPWKRLTARQRKWVLEGEGSDSDGVWFGVKRFFEYLETKSYKMHVRVMLSKYRSYDVCDACSGARLKSESLLWRVGTRKDADTILPPVSRFRPVGVSMSPETLRSLPGLTMHDVVSLPISSCRSFMEDLHLPDALDEASELLLKEIRSRLRYLVDVGVGYLTLDRQSRTLSGGEVQRINLTTALGTSLVNSLFVLDEPSVGLHSRDMGRVVEVLHRLRDAGNSLLVVEHDPQVMMAADRILDLGPGPGERGGRRVFFGAPRELLKSKRSLTASYLRGDRQVTTPSEAPPKAEKEKWIEILGAEQHNLKGVDVKIPLNRLVCVTGVSGSGKSTLMQNICYRGLRKLKQSPTDPPGRHRAIRGHERVDDVVMVDQSPIGKSARSNPASYVGALTSIRRIFAAQPLARQRGYRDSAFSFNSGMRCPACGGNGFEHVEMQFLSDVYIRCADCDGSRFRPEVLDVRAYPSGEGESSGGAGGRSIADVLDMTVTEAVHFFAQEPAVQTALLPLQAVGLGYLKLGQPVPTLSGGEAQRLKLAGHLAKSARKRSEKARTLFLFDEPTTGLHFDDVAVLLAAFRELLSKGHSIVVIEHHLDVVRSADWVIDLGPEGGEAGGHVVCVGPPEAIKRHRTSHTARALRQEISDKGVRAGSRPGKAPGAGDSGSRTRAISVHKAREHNLQNIDLEIPRNEFTVITGISGSGKSTVAFDILFAEGQRRYLDSLNAYARQFVQPAARPDVDAIYGIPPTVAIEQRTSRGGRKSTVGTLTEGYHFLRLLFVKLGVQHCPDCDLAIQPQTPESIRARIQKRYRERRVVILSPLVVSRKGYYTDLAKWAAGKGYKHLRVDGELIATDPWPRLDRFKEHDIELPVGEVMVGPSNEKRLATLIAAGLDRGNGMVRVVPAKGPARGRAGEIFSTLRACPGCGRSFDELDPRLFSYNSRHGWCSACYGTGLKMSGFDEEQTGEEAWWNEWWEEDASACRACAGTRLRPEARAVRFRNRTISDLNELSVEAALKFFSGLKVTGRDAEIARDILPELKSRLEFLARVGLTYLTLDRSAPTLSGGEAQRIRLAAQLGSNLRGVCYILDEPTIGLHARDNLMLLDTLQSLEKKGNTVVVVEHDEETIRRAGHVIDLGPGAGINGGKVVAEGSAVQLTRNSSSITGHYLKHPLLHPLRESPRKLPGKSDDGWLSIEGATLHNLRAVNARFPLECLICVSGVSGSGKSTLVRDILHANLVRYAGRRRRKRAGANSVQWFGCREVRGAEAVQRVLEVDQSPIGKTPRSCPATYVGVWDHIRRLYAESTESKIRGFGPGRFSFNVRGGRCAECDGQGMKKIEMNFLPDVKVPCDVCDGARFNPETLDVLYRGKSIGDLLAMSIDEAVEFFSAHASIHHTLLLLQDVGLGYLTLGQQSPTLSGGEAQRVKLVTELAKAGSGKLRGRGSVKTLYLLDEPTVGLHMADVEKLIQVIHRLVDAGNTVVVIEHHLDVIAEADWIVDLGPEGGSGGGRVVAQGPPSRVASASAKRSHTGPILSAFLSARRRED